MKATIVLAVLVLAASQARAQSDVSPPQLPQWIPPAFGLPGSAPSAQQSAAATETQPIQPDPKEEPTQPDPKEARILPLKVWACYNERQWLMGTVEILEHGGLSNAAFHMTSATCHFLTKNSLVRIVETDTVKVVAGGPHVVTTECLRPIYPYGGEAGPKCFWTNAGVTLPFTEELPDHVTFRNVGRPGEVQVPRRDD